VVDWNGRTDYGFGGGPVVPPILAFEEQHFPIRYWSQRWGFSEKTIREWFRDEYGPGILRQPNLGRRKKRSYTTIMISPSAAARVYAKRIGTTAEPER
jgi:hypothetical protein